MTAALKQRRTADRVHASVAAVERYVRANWPAVRRFAGVAAARVGDVLAAVVTYSVAGSEWAWRTARERLREGGAGPTPAQVERGSYSSAVVPPDEPPELPEPPIEPTPGRESPLAE